MSIDGPVPSWRLGRSLGIDLLPGRGKTCCFATPTGDGHTNVDCGSVYGGRSNPRRYLTDLVDVEFEMLSISLHPSLMVEDEVFAHRLCPPSRFLLDPSYLMATALGLERQEMAVAQSR